MAVKVSEMPDSHSTEKPFDPLLIKYFDKIRNVVGPRLMTLSNYIQDTQEATDLVVLRPIVSVETPSMGVRIRSHLPNEDWYDEFTIRSKSKYGNRTEINKFISGNPDWFFYCILNADGSNFSVWHLIDVRKWASIYSLSISGEIKLWTQDRNNGDGTAFKAFTIRGPMREAVIASNHPKYGKD